jgi:hypothetical protein
MRRLRKAPPDEAKKKTWKSYAQNRSAVIAPMAGSRKSKARFERQTSSREPWTKNEGGRIDRPPNNPF